MAYQLVFKRYELKYMLSLSQKERILNGIMPYMQADEHGRATVRNIYFDTDSYRLIRRSIEKPAYKEKLRIRSYSKATSDSTVFVELKKKYEKVVYKRRLPLRECDAMSWICGGGFHPPNTQIAREIDYFLEFYERPVPKVFLSYEREAYYDKSDRNFRVTFDDNILCRESDVDLCSDVYGTPVLEDGKVLMELKCCGGLPLWMADILSRERLFKIPFSKYGTAYTKLIYPNIYANNFTDKEIIKNGCNI